LGGSKSMVGGFAYKQVSLLKKSAAQDVVTMGYLLSCDCQGQRSL